MPLPLFEILSVALLVFGFGFVIFFHELGHFLAAKYVGIKVEQFAVGFGQALFSWRKGMGFTWGSSGRKYEELIAQAAEPNSKIDVNQIGETEYRLNWIPLGGYVKMLGQDDLKPNAQADDPRAYNKKSIGARMLVVSAGVIMNVILAAIGFMVVFLIGFDAPPAVAGGIMPGSPAQKATLQVGDEILYFDGKRQHDFTKITLYPALAEEGAPVPMQVKRAGSGKIENLTIYPRRMDGDPKAFLMLGMEPPRELRGVESIEFPKDPNVHELYPAEMLAIRSGDVITAINGEPIADAKTEYYKLDRALQASGGKPVELTVKDAAGAERIVPVQPHFAQPFTKDPLSFAGMLPRARVAMVVPNSAAAKAGLRPGDIVLSITYANNDLLPHPSTDQLMKKLSDLGDTDEQFDMTVLREGQQVTLSGLRASQKIERGRYGLGVQLEIDDRHAIVASLASDSAAQRAGIEAGSTITAINGTKIENWFDVQRVLAHAQEATPVSVVTQSKGGEEKTATLKLTGDQIQQLANSRFTHGLLLHEHIEPRKTTNPITAAGWGVLETRDFILQFYLTLQRMFQGSVSYTNMMGPVGIFHAGTKFAFKGTDWLIWFLAMISANLAVVNFLPIPIVDGGLFTFLIIEKLQGKPVSPRTQAIAQVVGLAMILGVFLLVTYQDIARFL